MSNLLLFYVLQCLFVLNSTNLTQSNYFGKGYQSHEKHKRLLQVYNQYNIQYKDSFHLGYRFAEEALMLSEELKDTQHQISALIYLGSYYNIFGNPSRAEQHYNSAARLNEKFDNPYFFAKIFLGRGSIYLKKNQIDSCLALTKKGLDYAYRINSRELIGYGHRLAGMACDKEGEKLKALRNFDKAEHYYKDDKSALASVYTSKGIIYGDAGKTELAVRYFRMALKIREEMDDFEMMGYLYSNLAGIYGTHLNHEKSIEHNLLALSVFKKTGDKKGLGYVLNNLGAEYFSTDRFDKALEYYKKSLFYRNQLPDKQAVLFTLNNLGETYLRLGMPDSSYSFLQKALIYSDQLKDKLSGSVTYNSLGKYYRSRKNFNSAIKYFSRSIELSEQIDYLPQLEDCYLQLSEIYKELNQPDKALEYLQLRNEVHDSVFSANAQSYIANAQVKYETDRLEKKEIVTNRLKIDRIIIWSLLFFVLILSAGTVYYYKNRILPRLKIADLLSTLKLKNIDDDKRKLRAIDKELLSGNEIHKKSIDSEILDSISEGLIKLLEEEKAYLISHLTLKEAAQKLNTNTSYLSKLINEKYQANFSTLINSYRVEEAKRLISENIQNVFSYEGIASESGFNSKSSFNTAFKKFTGLTPTEFARSLSSSQKSCKNS